MKSLALVLVGVVAATGCHGLHGLHFGSSVQGSGKSATRKVSVGPGKEVKSFTKINTHGSFDVNVKIGAQSDLVVTGDDNIVKLVEFRVDGQTLHIKTTDSYSTHLGLKVDVTVPKLNGYSIDGSGDAVIAGAQGEELGLSISGSGSIRASGSSKKLSAAISGSGDIDASEVTADSASADISGSGTIKVGKSQALAAAIAGSGDILYKGKPSVSKSIHGSGDVRPF